MTSEGFISRLSHLRYEFRSFDSVPLTFPVGLIVGIVIVLGVWYAKSPWRRVPPGPSGFPVLGNAFKLRDMTWLLGQDCKKQYSMSTSATGHDSCFIGRIYSRRDDVLYRHGSAHHRHKQQQSGRRAPRSAR